MRKEKKYFGFMGCLTFIISIALLVAIIITIIDMFKVGARAWPIVEQFLLLAGVLVVGPGIGSFFFSYACSNDYNRCEYYD